MDNNSKETILNKLKEMKEIQKDSLINDYMVGYYNGIELTISVIENRRPEFKSIPGKVECNDIFHTGIGKIKNMPIVEPIKEKPITKEEEEKEIKYVRFADIGTYNIDGFKKELEELINKYCLENTCNTPDFILSDFLFNCLRAFVDTTITRDKWYDFDPWKDRLNIEKEKPKGLEISVNVKDYDGFKKIINLLDEIKNDEKLPEDIKEKIINRIDEITRTYDYLEDETQKAYEPMKSSYNDGVFSDTNMENMEEEEE